MTDKTIINESDWLFYLYRIIWILFFCCLLGILYVSYTESYRISHAIISPFSEQLKGWTLFSAVLSFTGISLSSIFSFFDNVYVSKFFLFVAEVSAIILEIFVCLVMVIIVFRLKGNDVEQQLVNLLVSLFC